MARMTVAEAVHFNSQPRKEADLKLLIFGNHFIISIHSLARRLTPIRAADRSGATHFNSQPRKEADGDPALDPWIKLDISIHSLARRLTRFSGWLSSPLIISIHSLARRLTTFQIRT